MAFGRASTFARVDVASKFLTPAPRLFSYKYESFFGNNYNDLDLSGRHIRLKFSRKLHSGPNSLNSVLDPFTHSPQNQNTEMFEDLNFRAVPDIRIRPDFDEKPDIRNPACLNPAGSGFWHKFHKK